MPTGTGKAAEVVSQDFQGGEWFAPSPKQEDNGWSNACLPQVVLWLLDTMLNPSSPMMMSDSKAYSHECEEIHCKLSPSTLCIALNHIAYPIPTQFKNSLFIHLAINCNCVPLQLERIPTFSRRCMLCLLCSTDNYFPIVSFCCYSGPLPCLLITIKPCTVSY